MNPFSPIIVEDKVNNRVISMKMLTQIDSLKYKLQ